MELMTRDDFRTAVFERDNHACVICGTRGTAAHHIIERRLWPDEGYYLDNGATLCDPCHMDAENGTYLPVDLRERIGITRVLLPEHLYADREYDKWGNELVRDGDALRLVPGELWDDESVQQVLKEGGWLDRALRYVKHPRTYHLPDSPVIYRAANLGIDLDDKVMVSLKDLQGMDVVVTEKMDGEQTTIYQDHVHARSIDSGSHPSRNLVRKLAGEVGWQLPPPPFRVCGENLYGRHSLAYEQLPAYFMVHSIWDTATHCLSWDDTEEWAELLGLTTVPAFYQGEFDMEAVRKAFWMWRWDRRRYIKRELYAPPDPIEGFVVRPRDSFERKDYRRLVGKYVSAVPTAEHHWLSRQVVPNKLAGVAQ